MSKPFRTYGLKRRQAWLRQLTVWVGLLCFMAHASSSLHMLFVDHVHCAEHGEMVHADEQHAHDHLAAAPSVLAAQNSVRPTGPEADHGHDHADCHACSERRKLSGFSLDSSQPDASFHDNTLSQLEQDHRKLKANVYRAAPKTSPPV